MTPAPAASAELAGLRMETAHLRRVNEELLATVAELRTTVEKQQAHIDRLVRMAFGRRSERVAGPTLFDALPDTEPTPAATAGAAPVPEPLTESAVPRPRPPPAAGRPAPRAGGDRPD